MPEQPIPAVVVEGEVDVEALEPVATQPEDEDPLALSGEPADPPEDTGRPEGVGP